MDITLNIFTLAAIILVALGCGAFGHKWLKQEAENVISGKK